MIFPEIGNCLDPFDNGWTPQSEKIIRLICRTHNVTWGQFHGDNRSPILVGARWTAWGRMSEELGMSSGQIARRCNRDSSTVRTGIQRYKKTKTKKKAV